MGADRTTSVSPPSRSRDAALQSALVRMGLVAPGETPDLHPLPGGVSSEIWRLDLARGALCVKRALPQLRVDATWLAPVERSGHEWDWYRLVAARLPGACPQPIAYDFEAKVFAMSYLPPERYRLWKDDLMAGNVDPDFAAAVGTTIGRIHAMTAHDPGVAAAFAHDACFHSLRLEPYLEATARAHPDLATELLERVRVTATTRHVLVHGDLSPKNILVGAQGPVLLDAECAWYGDPAFDLAFCLNHLLLKGLVQPARAEPLTQSFRALADAYRVEVAWEPWTTLEARVVPLLAGLFLARVDGKSPVEYLRREEDRDRVRATARRWLGAPPAHLHAMMDDWRAELAR